MPPAVQGGSQGRSLDRCIAKHFLVQMIHSPGHLILTIWFRPHASPIIALAVVSVIAWEMLMLKSNALLTLPFFKLYVVSTSLSLSCDDIGDYYVKDLNSLVTIVDNISL